uniref:Uncharacterized protein n=1 Tax=Heterorhabditis bacteriophora TaxID=37862 RepID=A0A1I7WHV4_HETBA
MGFIGVHNWSLFVVFFFTN